MIRYQDEEYQATKLIKQGDAYLEPPFDDLAEWISETWQVTVLNIISDRRNELHAPRLQVILEHAADVRKFEDGLNFDHGKQAAIVDRFRELVSSRPSDFDVTGLFVVFSAFAPIALEEADDQISKEDVEALRLQMGDPELWCISRFFGKVTFFFYTDQQVKKRDASSRAAYARSYFALLKPHDEFGYLSEDEFSVAFDSKQNFDRNYRGNWLNYYR